MKEKIRKLTIVGAGPGEAELITLKGLKALQTADIILYDALVDQSLLEMVPGIPTLFVGKRRGFKAFGQQEINEIIVKSAGEYGHVVRLKGGDPYVFGRGMEELHFAAEQGIPVTYIPGITSAVAAAGAVGIAVTLRGASRGFWTMTATTDTGELNPDILKAALADTTVVILMGIAKIREIISVFESSHIKDTAIAIIQNATLPDQKAVFGVLSDIENKLSASGITNPAVIIIGDVVTASRFPVPQDAAIDYIETDKIYS